MSISFVRACARILRSPLILAGGLILAFVAVSSSDASSSFVNGFLVRSLPPAYAAQERLFSALGDSGANTVIIRLPLGSTGEPDGIALANAVYLVHEAGLRIFVIMPTRRAPAVLETHPAWEDRRYDLAENSTDRAGKLDLFQQSAVAYLAALGKTVASYSVDGILLAEDFTYEIGEGLGKTAVAETEKRLHMPLSAKRLFVKIDRRDERPVVTEYGKAFLPWTEAKRDRLLESYEAIRSAARSVKPSIRVGVPVPVQLPVAVPAELFSRHAFDADAYKRIDVDLYWTAIEHREEAGGERITFSEGVELLSRSAYAAISSVKDVDKLIVVLQATMPGGRPLPLTEIEEITGLVRHAGRTGIAYSVIPGAVPSPVLTRKMFR